MKGKPVLSKDEQSKEKDVRKRGLIILCENAFQGLPIIEEFVSRIFPIMNITAKGPVLMGRDE